MPSINNNSTFGQKAADFAAKHIGSWAFLNGFNAFIICYCIFQELLGKHSFDPAPFIGLNLILSWLAGVQAPLIMISNNRQEEIQRKTLSTILHLAESHTQILKEMSEHDRREAEFIKKILDEQDEHD